MKALYRRYRPRSLDEVVGQPQITDILSHSIKNGKISHAYLFIGPRGTGKTSVARILAHEINGFKYELEDDYLDIIEIDAASNTGVDNIRDLRERAIIAPTKGKYKVYIIDEVHMLSKSAFNALLKTLEEPPEHVIFIMATTDAHKVPVTITSRSQVFTFKLADPGTMLEHLKNICKKEKIDIDDEALKIVVKRGGGSFRDSLSLLDQVSTLSDGKITAELLNESLGLPQDELVEKLLTAYASTDTTTVNQTLRELLDSGIKAEIIATELIDRILEKPEPAYLPLLDKLTDVSRNAHPNAKLLLAFYGEQATAPRIAAPAPAPQKAAPTPTVPKAAPANPKEEPKPEPAPAKATIVATGSSGDEIWQTVLENVRENAPMELSNFEKAHYCLNGTTFEVHATNAFIRKRLDTKRSLITSVLPESYTILISDQPLAVDPDIANIMDAIGGGEEIEIDE